MHIKSALMAGMLMGTGLAGPALAGPSTMGSVLLQYAHTDDAITRAFRATLRRPPSDRELRRYRTLMERDRWTERDVRRDLAGRTDYYRSSNRRLRPDAAVRDAYLDILGRDPDPEGLANYREKIRRAGWTEQDVRDALRKSDEYREKSFQDGSADRIIRRAYRDVLQREPDADGLNSYRRFVLEDGWEYHDVRQALLRSPEYRNRRR
jgi:hypothetical protein